MEDDNSDMEVVEETPSQEERLGTIQEFTFMVSQLTNRIMIWNYRGEASKAFQRVCKQLVKENNPYIVVIVETRMEPHKLEKTFILLGFNILVRSEVRGFSGGISMAWKSNRVKVDVLQKYFKFLHTKIKFEGEEECLFTPVYACPREDGRKELRQELHNLSKQNQES